MPNSAQKNNRTEPATNTTSSPKRFLSKRTLLIAGGFFVLAAVVLILGLFYPAKKTTEENSDLSGSQQNEQSENLNNSAGSSAKISQTSLNTLVYGAWNGKQSVIKSVDLTSNKATLLATLPLSIKKVGILSPTQLLYIDQTDTRDHGKQIVRYKVKGKTQEVILKADDGFGIDDYVLSPDKRYLAVWEVAFAKGSEVLQGGQSRVYAIDLANPKTKQKLFDEAATQPVHYPQAILNNGKVFADTFLPNDPNGGTGWAYGMTVINFDGSGKQDLDQMQNGSYGTQPFLSPDGKLLIFAGYDGTRGDGKAIKNGYRQAILSPNTVETLDTATLKRQKIQSLSNKEVYSSVDWGSTSNNIIVTILSDDINKTGLFSYNLTSNSLSEINLPEENQVSYSYVSQLSQQGLLMGKVDDSSSSLGNLGDGYMPSLTKLYAQRSGSQNAQLIGLDDVLVQYITVLPENYFQNVLAATDPPLDGSFNPKPTLIELNPDKYSGSRENLQLRTFSFPKPDLLETREKQQSAPKPTPVAKSNPTTRVRPTDPPSIINDSCTELAKQQCGVQNVKFLSAGQQQCINTNKEKNRATRNTPDAVCKRSPLYLYGQTGQTVSVNIQTPVFNDTPQYNNGYSVKLLSGGEMEIGGKTYQAINYDYKSNLRLLRAPNYGTFVKKSDLEKTLTEYANKLGLNKKETADLVRFGKTTLTTPYTFISFYNQKTSEQILPLSFNPQPDNYLNVVFYFKRLSDKPSYTPVPPVFPPVLNRTGFTAVEVSEIVE